MKTLQGLIFCKKSGTLAMLIIKTKVLCVIFALFCTISDSESAEPFDILINEIMADPSPQIALPNAEFVELYNRSDKMIDLLNYGLASGSSLRRFPEFVMLPGDYVIVCDEEDVALFSAFGSVVGLDNFPGLTNAADEIIFTDDQDQIIDAVRYTDKWYRNIDKDAGGWTLERINPESPCEGSSNWRASESILGGTPGKVNSVIELTPDRTPPKLIEIYPTDANSIRLTFSEALDQMSATEAGNYTISHSILVTSAEVIDSRTDQILLRLSEELEIGRSYTMQVEPTVTDCVSNPIDEGAQLAFGLPQAAVPEDLLINEILFDPPSGGADFVELYNNSTKYIDLNELFLANFFQGRTEVEPVSLQKLFAPHTYLVFTPDRADILSRYFTSNADGIVETELPGLPNDAGNITVFAVNELQQPVIINTFDYEVSFHYSLLDKTEGVSLERIRLDKSTQNPDNWHSAAATVGFATPAYRNSQAANEMVETTPFALINSTFSPDGDGFKDYLLLQFHLNQAGYTANVKIYDAQGREVNQIANNLLLGSVNELKWDGTDHNGRRAGIGIYILWIELFDPEGKVRHFKDTTVVAGKLD